MTCQIFTPTKRVASEESRADAVFSLWGCGVYPIDRVRIPFLICAIEGRDKDAAEFDDAIT